VQVRKPKRGDEVELVVEELDDKGCGLARHADHRFHVRGAVPGSRVRATVHRRRKNHVDAALIEVLEPSGRAVEAPCPHFGVCGGCSFQNLAYAAQLEELHRLLAHTLGEFPEVEVEPVIGCDDPWHYRNKMDFTFSNRRWIETDEPEGVDRGFALGLHPSARHDKVLDVKSCAIAFAEAGPILNTVREVAVDLGLDAWDTRDHCGLLRHLVLRKGFATGEILAQLVTTEEAPERIAPLVAAVLERHPELTTVVQAINSGVALVAVGEERVLHGPGRIHEEVCGLRFTISAQSFFQTNTAQAERLVARVVEHAQASPGQRVFDLYCGCGTFSLPLARAGVDVVGFELVESAVEDARRNAAANGIETARFVAGDLTQTLTSDSLEALGLATPDLCIVDPPRAGMHPRALGSLRRLAPRRIVYVSCKPSSAVRDMQALRVDGYRLLSAQPIDLFPHTPHLECVFVLARD